jgi:hypothetical protein
MGRAGRLYITWYMEGAKEEPGLLFATSTDVQHHMCHYVWSPGS